MKALILAAGLGKRLGLQNIPKPMYKLAGKPILEHNILLLRKHNIREICINLHHFPEVIKKYFNDGSNWGVKIQYSFEKELLGTSGAVKNIESFWDKKRFFIVYGDNYTNVNLTEMLSAHLSTKSLATIAIFDPSKTVNSGVAGGYILLDQNNKILSFTEGKRSQIGGYVNAGVYILEPAILDMIPNKAFSDFGKDIFPEVINKGFLLTGYVTSDFVMAVDTKEALDLTEKTLSG